MEYKWSDVGKRIYSERKGLRIEQAELGARLDPSVARQTIGRWEKGHAVQNFAHVLQMCKIFDCELGYLLCEYDCKTRDATDVQKVTGLSKNAIDVLFITNDTIHKQVFGQMVEHRDFNDFLSAILTYLGNKKYAANVEPTEQDKETLARLFGCDPGQAKNYAEAISKSTISLLMMRIINDVELDKEA